MAEAAIAYRQSNLGMAKKRSIKRQTNLPLESESIPTEQKAVENKRYEKVLEVPAFREIDTQPSETSKGDKPKKRKRKQ